MGATRYMILYRATNENANVVLTNSGGRTEQYAELYHSKHKIQVGTDDEKKAATEAKDKMIIDGNLPDNLKYSQIYEYAGAERIPRKDWIPEKDGYVIRDCSKITDQITDTKNCSEDGDYSGKYLLVEGDKPENGVVVAKKSPIDEEYGSGGYVISDNQGAENGAYYKNIEEIRQKLINATIAEIDFEKNPLDINLGRIVGGITPKPGYFKFSTYTFKGGSKPSYAYNLSVKIGADVNFIPSVGVDKAVIYSVMSWRDFERNINSGNMFASTVTLNTKHLKTYKIPAHWEISTDAPYCVHDVYNKVMQEPWFQYSIRGSFQASLEDARMLIDKIGLENVKMIKLVPTDQFLKTL